MTQGITAGAVFHGRICVMSQGLTTGTARSIQYMIGVGLGVRSEQSWYRRIALPLDELLVLPM